ncbi:MAG TPA: hypothetical protein VF150_01440, partial [Thermoanaerobaculia bacterium]
MIDPESARARYEDLRASASKALCDGRLAAAVRRFAQAAGLARQIGEADLAAVALAHLTLAAIESATLPPPSYRKDLREAVGCSRVPESRYFCALAL